MKTIACALLAALAACTAGCAADGTERGDFLASQPPLVELEGRPWQLVELGGQSVSLPPGSDAPFITFDTQGGKASGHGGCNRFFGSFQISGATLRFEELATTRMACPEPFASIEQQFLTALGETDGFAMDHRKLLLLSGSTVLARLQ